MTEKRKFIRGGWDIARLMLLSGCLAIALVAPHTASACEPRQPFWLRILGSMLVFSLLWPLYRWMVLHFEDAK